MKKKINWLSLLIGSGIWLQPPSMIFLIWWLGDGWQQQMEFCLLLSLCPPFLFFALSSHVNIRDDVERPYAMYPNIPAELSKARPGSGDIILGRYKRKYVCRNIREDGHYLIIGGSGSGKSSCIIIPTLLAQVGSDTTCFVLDIKGELSSKATRLGDEKIRIFNPQDKNTWGYDPFAGLTTESSDQQVFETMQSIAYSLITLPASVKDPFWKNAARQMLIGLLFFYYRQGHTDLVTIVDLILSKSIEASIEIVIQSVPPTDIAFKFIAMFQGLEQTTLSGIYTELVSNITLLATDADLRWALRDAPRQIAPSMLEDGYSLYIVIREEKLAAYSCMLRLLIDQTLSVLEKRPETATPVIMCIDELPRILSAGKIDRLLDASRTLRSRRVRLMLVTQSLESLMTAYSENEAIDLLSNMTYKMILDASSSKTQKMVCEWAGKFKELKRSASKGKEQSYTENYERMDILYPSDLMTLVKTDELILISPHGYNRLEKCKYYQDAHFKPLAGEINEYNQNIGALYQSPSGNGGVCYGKGN